MPSGFMSGVRKAFIRRSQRTARFFRLHAVSPPRSPLLTSQSPSSPSRFDQEGVVSLKSIPLGGHCMPPRLSVMIESVLTILIASVVAAMVWFEVDTERDISVPLNGRRVLILLGFWWTCFLTASLFGLAGSIIRKRAFVVIYGAYLYLHLLVTLIVAAGLLGVVFWASEQQIILACQGTIRDHYTSQQCARLFNKAKGRLVFFGSLVLLLELYGAWVVMRYAQDLRSDAQRLFGDLSELEPITRRRSEVTEDHEKDRLLISSAHYDPDSLSDDELCRYPRSLYTIGEGSSSRDSSADRGSRLEGETNVSVGSSSSDTAVEDDGPIFKLKQIA